MRIRMRARIAAYFVLSVAILTTLAPIGWTLLTSLKDRRDALAIPPKLVGFALTLVNYQNVLNDPTFSAAAFVSVVVTLFSTVIAVAVGTLTAYAFLRLRVVGRAPLNLVLAGARLVPGIVLVVPLYVIVVAVGMYDSIPTLVVVYAALALPFTTWLALAFLREIPVEIEEAALVDGASRLQVLVRIVVPIAAPGLAATTILTAVGAWNEFLVPAILSESNARTLTVVVAGFVSARTVDWGSLSAGAIIVMFPIVVLTFAVQRYLVAGISAGSLNG